MPRALRGKLLPHNIVGDIVYTTKTFDDIKRHKGTCLYTILIISELQSELEPKNALERHRNGIGLISLHANCGC